MKLRRSALSDLHSKLKIVSYFGPNTCAGTAGITSLSLSEKSLSFSVYEFLSSDEDCSPSDNSS